MYKSTISLRIQWSTYGFISVALQISLKCVAEILRAGPQPLGAFVVKTKRNKKRCLAFLP